MNVDGVSLLDTVLIDQTLGAPALGEMLHEEYKVTSDVLELEASRFPHDDVVITGQPGIGQ